jgi:hypothetical protein
MQYVEGHVYPLWLLTNYIYRVYLINDIAATAAVADKICRGAMYISRPTRSEM